MSRRTRFLDGTGQTSLVSRSRSLIKSIQRGTIVLNGVASNTGTITAVVMTNSVLKHTGQSESSGDSSASFGRLTLTNTTTITADRQGGAGVLTVSYEIIEYVPGVIKSIQRGTITTNAVASNTATITAVNTAKTFVDHLGFNTNDAASGNGQNWVTRLTLTNTTTVTVNVGIASALQITNYQVVELF